MSKYAFTAKPKVYQINKHDLGHLPLEDLTHEYFELRDELQDAYHIQFASQLKKEQERFLATWNKTNEASYEGSFEELNLEGKVLAKLGDMPDFRTSKEAVTLLEGFASKYAVPKNADWFWSQTLAKFSQLPLVKNSNGKYSPKRLFVDNIKENEQLYALWLISTYPKRSIFLDKQTDIKHKNYSSLVPIIMSAFKKFNNIDYSEWDRAEIFGITESNLTAAMLLDSVPEMTSEEILEEREYGLTTKTGDRAGEVRNPMTSYAMYLRGTSPLAALPTLARIMLCQIWCAHHMNRTQYMILNPLDWDDMPESLISAKVVRSAHPWPSVTSDVPWDS